MNTDNEYSFQIHDVTVSIAGPSVVVQALQSRLRRLPAGDASKATIYFHYQICEATGAHSIDKPTATGRAFYELPIGESLYYADDSIYLDFDSRVRALCHPAEGHCTISLLTLDVEHLWFGTHLLFTIALIELLKRKGKYGVHAAGVAAEGRCLLLSGTSGSGKSTLSVALLRAGFDFLGDDMVFLEAGENLSVFAFPETLDVTDKTVSFFPELREYIEASARPSWSKHEIEACDAFGSAVAWSASPAAIIFPRISENPESTLQPISSEEAFLEVVQTVLLTEPQSTRLQIEALAELVRSVPSYRLHTGRDFDSTAQLLRALLSGTAVEQTQCSAAISS